ncbi:MAG: hypothetical protein WA996_05105 [Candidatus Promineifilaceae bacterium]
MTDERTIRKRLTLHIAGFFVLLETDDELVGNRIRSRYQDFLCTEESPHISIEINVIPEALYIEPKPGPWIIEAEFEDDRLTFQSYLERGEVNLVSGRGYLDVAPEANIENFLRAVFAWLCVKNDGVLLHAAGVIRNGLGYVFFGPSGAGKTTASRIAARSSDVVSDDLVVIRIEKGVGILHGVPFRGEMSDVPRANQKAPLKGIFRIRQDTDHFIEPISRVTAVADLVASSPFVVRELSLTDLLVDVCDMIVRSVPVMALHFKRDDGFWKVIDEHFEDVPKTASANGG